MTPLIKHADALATLKEYLEKPYAPGVIGAAAGATAAGLVTGPRRGENARQRSLRVIRNALAGGLVGGVGGQLMTAGTKDVIKAVNGVAPDGKPGFMRSLGPRVALMGAYRGLAGVGTDKRLAESLQRYFKGMGDVHTGTSSNPGPTFKMDPPSGFTGKTVDHYKDLVGQLRAAATDKVNWPTDVDRLIQGNINGSAARGNPEQLRRWLRATFDPVTTSPMAAITRKLFPHSSHYAARWERGMYRGGGALGMVGAFMAPDIIAATGKAFSGAGGEAAKDYLGFGGGAKTENTNPLTRGLDPLSLSSIPKP